MDNLVIQFVIVFFVSWAQFSIFVESEIKNKQTQR